MAEIAAALLLVLKECGSATAMAGDTEPRSAANATQARSCDRYTLLSRWLECGLPEHWALATGLEACTFWWSGVV